MRKEAEQDKQAKREIRDLREIRFIDQECRDRAVASLLRISESDQIDPDVQVRACKVMCDFAKVDAAIIREQRMSREVQEDGRVDPYTEAIEATEPSGDPLDNIRLIG